MLVHKADLRLRNNAGINYPVCLADDILGCFAGEVSNDESGVTCQACVDAWEKAYPWAEPIVINK